MGFESYLLDAFQYFDLMHTAMLCMLLPPLQNVGRFGFYNYTLI